MTDEAEEPTGDVMTDLDAQHAIEGFVCWIRNVKAKRGVGKMGGRRRGKAY